MKTTFILIFLAILGLNTAQTQIVNENEFIKINKKSTCPDGLYFTEGDLSPYSPTLRNEFSLMNSSQVDLQIINIDGNTNSIILSQKFSPGVYEIQFNGPNIGSGIFDLKFSAMSIESKNLSIEFIAKTKFFVP